MGFHVILDSVRYIRLYPKFGCGGGVGELYYHDHQFTSILGSGRNGIVFKSCSNRKAMDSYFYYNIYKILRVLRKPAFLPFSV